MFEKVPKKPLQKLLKLSDNKPVEFYGEVYRSDYPEDFGKTNNYKKLEKPRKAISFPEDHGEDNDGNMLVSYEDGKPLLRGIKKVLKKKHVILMTVSIIITPYSYLYIGTFLKSIITYLLQGNW